MDDLSRAVGPKKCDCDNEYPAFSSCPLTQQHERVAAEIRTLFPRGARVYYNFWAYPPNCPARVVGYTKNWSWIRLKFDHLKNSRAVPIYRGRFHLSTEPLDRDTLYRLDLRGGMENIDRNGAA